MELEIPVTMKNVHVMDEAMNFDRTVLPTETALLTKCDEEKLMELNKLNEWFTCIELEKELFHRESFLRHLIAKVDPVSRVVIIKVKKGLEAPLFKRIICIPHFVNMHGLKVKVVVEKKLIMIRAPFTCNTQTGSSMWRNLEPCYNTPRLTTDCILPRDAFITRQGEFSQWHMQPTVYKMLKQLRKYCPTFITPRYMPRCNEVGVFEPKVVLDIRCTKFRPEDVTVKVNELERCLAIKVLRECAEIEKNVICKFMPRHILHELFVPTLFHLPRCNWFKLNEKTVRIEMPIITEKLNSWRLPTTNTMEVPCRF